MNCYQDVNALFKDELSCIEGRMWDQTGPYRGSDFVKEELERLIDHMGAQAAKVPRKLDMLVLYDIYVAQKFRRLGHGRKLLDFVSRHEKVAMHHMVLDQPSPALLQLFMKHYYLRDFVTVETRYTLWKRFMDEQRPASKVGVRHLNTGHTYTTNPRDYLGGPWPISLSIGTKVEHPFVNWHQPTTCVPGYHYELSPSQQRIYNNRFYRHDNSDKATALHKMRISHHPFSWT